MGMYVIWKKKILEEEGCFDKNVYSADHILSVVFTLQVGHGLIVGGRGARIHIMCSFLGIAEILVCK